MSDAMLQVSALLYLRSDNATLRNLNMEWCGRDSKDALVVIDSVKSVLLDGVEFHNNKSTGGPTCVSGTSSQVDFWNVHVPGNTGGAERTLRSPDFPGLHGGATFFQTSILSISNSVFEENLSVNDGGAVYIKVIINQIIKKKFYQRSFKYLVLYKCLAHYCKH